MTSLMTSCTGYFSTMTKMAVDQKYAIKFMVLKKRSKQEVVEEIGSTFGERAMKKTCIYKWYNRFADGWEKADDLPRTGRKATSVTGKHVRLVKNLIDCDRRLTVREICERLNLSYGTVHRILKRKLKMKKVAARWIPKLLDSVQKQKRVEAARNFLDMYRKSGANFINKIVTVDETWVPLFDPETKQESSVWKTPSSPSPQKAKVTKSQKKQMFVIFYDVEGIVLTHAVPIGQTINSEYYKKVLNRHFCRAMRRKRPGKIDNFLLHHDNAPAHASESTTNYMKQLGFQCVPHPPYSPDLSPNDFYLFPKLKAELRGVKMNSLQELRTKVLNVLSGIPKEDYRKSLFDWIARWERCIQHSGEYFEKL